MIKRIRRHFEALTDIDERSLWNGLFPILVMVLLAAVSLVVTYLFAINFSSFAVAQIKIAIWALNTILADRFIIRGVNTMREIVDNRNTAYAVLLTGFSITIGLIITFV